MYIVNVFGMQLSTLKIKYIILFLVSQNEIMNLDKLKFMPTLAF